MTYHVARNNQQLGAFSKEDAAVRYASGEILPTDLVWTEGMANWQPAAQVLGAPVAQPPPLISSGTSMPSAVAPANGTNSRPAKPGNNLALTIVASAISLVFCNILGLALGAIGIVFAAQVDNKYKNGDYVGAGSSAKTAAILGWTSLVLAIVLFAAFFVFGFARGFVEVVRGNMM